MSLTRICDRCSTVARDDALPPNWRAIEVLVKGSTGMRSVRIVDICESCDDDLYDWFNQP